MSDSVPSEFHEPFRPRARLLQLLGDELIGSARLAVFELVKNAYDADANKVVVRIDLASEDEPGITIEDDGEGMTLDVLRSVWLIPGNDHRQKQRLSDKRTAKHRRLPLGEKGLGRFAAHKLGNHITLVTRAQGKDECVVEIDWGQLISKEFLAEAPVTIQVRRPEVFLANRTGTRIEIRQLRTEWPRGEVRRLHNQITSICSPFEEPGGFEAKLAVPGKESWVEDLPDIHAVLGHAIWKFSFQAKDQAFDWTYEFCQVPGFALDGRVVQKTGDRLKLPSRSGDDRMEKKVVADAEVFNGIGLVTGEFYVYDRDREVLKRMPDIGLLKSYLNETGGVRVYRDGIRVYNYGEQGDDWLGLDLRRVNVPTRRISNNIILGAIHLSLKQSTGLIEKTNREGFVENKACQELRRIVLGALAALEEERQFDKDRIRKLTKKADDPVSARIEKPIQELRRELKRQGVQDQFENYVAKIEQDYQNMQETLLTAGMSGLNLAIVFHEVERGVRALHQAISEGADMERAARQARDLMGLLDGFSTLLRRDSKKRHSVGKLLKAAQTFNVLRFRHHCIQVVCSSLQEGNEGFQSRFSFGLVVGALNNLLDNALYWLRVRWPEVPEPGESPERKLYIGLSEDFEAGPAIIVADNGTGFQGDPKNLVRPFFTRKPEGMGLGLYYANLAMELNGGQLVFPHPGEVKLPEGFDDGAVVALIFKEAQS